MNPPKYIEGLPRVSQIVEFAFPFVGFARDRFHEWLRNNQIELEDYMKEASEGGTYVHTAMETYAATGKWSGKKYPKIVKSGIQFHKDTGIETLASEHYIRTKDYQGTIDRVAVYNGEVWILDWKCWALAKDKFGLPNEYKKNYSKLKKAQLQLSMYAHAMGIKNIAIVELRNEGYYFHKLDVLPIEDIQKIITEFKYNHVDEL